MTQTTRYYNLIQEKYLSSSLGDVIRINIRASLENRLKFMTRNPEIKLVRRVKNIAEYEVKLNKNDSSTIGLRVSNQGNVSIYKHPKNNKFHLKELKKTDAEKIVDDTDFINNINKIKTTIKQ